MNSIPEPTYGGQLQDLSIQGHKAEGQIKIDYKEKPVKLAGGEMVHLRVPGYSIVDLGYGPLAPDTMISPRVAPPMIGLGLLEAVPEEQILANADPDDADQDGISGKPNQVWSREQNKVMLGRFGWKAGVPSIDQQAAEAANGDIGLSTTLIRAPSGDCTEKREGLSRCAERQFAAISERRARRRSVQAHRVLLAQPRRPAAAQSRRPRGAEGQGSCSTRSAARAATSRNS